MGYRDIMMCLAENCANNALYEITVERTKPRARCKDHSRWWLQALADNMAFSHLEIKRIGGEKLK